MDDWFSTLSKGSELPPDRAQELQEHGFVVLRSLVPSGQTDQLARAYDAAVASAAEDEVRTGSTTTRVTDFVNRGAEFDDVYVFPPLLEACCQIIRRPFKLSSMHARTLRSGAAAQELHADVRRDSADWPLVGFILMVDEFRADNGATRFVPGSHHDPNAPEDVVADIQADHEGQVLACGPAGSLLIFHGSAWHGHIGEHVRSAAPLAPGCVHPQGRARLDRFHNADASRDARAPQFSRAVCAPPLTDALPLNVSRPQSFLRPMKVAAYQAPIAACADARVLSLVRQQVDRCEALGMRILCCPEALLGGLADYGDQPDRIAIETGTGHLARILAPLASDRVSTVIGFTERGNDGYLYNAAAVFARGAVIGIYRKVHPAINRSVYRAGVEAPRALSMTLRHQGSSN